MSTPDKTTQTPLTDAEAGYPDSGGCWKYNDLGLYVDADFARSLELALSASKAREAELVKALEWWRGLRAESEGRPMSTNANEAARAIAEIRQRYADSSKHLVNWRGSDIKVLLLEIQRLQAAAKSKPDSGLSALDFTRLRDWFADPHRKPAMLAFTAGPARDAATAFESAASGKDGATPELERELAEARKECEEQARLNGMGSEREARLLARLDASERPSKGKTAPKAFSDRLRALASWLIKRADEPHNELTTRSMLRNKVEEALSSPNAKAQTRAEEKL